MAVSKNDVFSVFSHAFKAPYPTTIHVDLVQGDKLRSKVSLMLDAEAFEVTYDAAQPAHARALTRALLGLFRALAAKQGLFVENRSGWCVITERFQSTVSYNSCTAMNVQRKLLRSEAKMVEILDAVMDTFSATTEPIHVYSNVQALHDTILNLHGIHSSGSNKAVEIIDADVSAGLRCDTFKRPWFLNPELEWGTTWTYLPRDADPSSAAAAKIFCLTEIISGGLCMSLSVGQALSELVARYSHDTSPLLHAVAAGVAIQEEYVSAIVTATVLTPFAIRSPRTAIQDFFTAFAIVRLGKRFIESIEPFKFFTREALSVFLFDIKDAETVEYLCSFAPVIDDIHTYLPAKGVYLNRSKIKALQLALFADRVRIMARLAHFRNTHPYSTDYFYSSYPNIFGDIMFALDVNVLTYNVVTKQAEFLHAFPTRWFIVLIDTPGHISVGGLYNVGLKTVTSAFHYTHEPQFEAFVHGLKAAPVFRMPLVLPKPVKTTFDYSTKPKMLLRSNAPVAYVPRFRKY